MTDGTPKDVRAGTEVLAAAIAANEETSSANDTDVPDGASLVERAGRAVNLIVRYGWIDGDHHKTWVLDQVARMLTGTAYPDLVAWATAPEDENDEPSEWDEGIAP